MAQDFENSLQRNISNSSGSATVLRTAANSDDAIIGVRCANTSGTAVNVTVYVKNGSNIYHIIKDAPIPAGSSLQLLDGGAKFVVQSGDKLNIVSDTASSLDVIVSAVDNISG